MRDELQLSATDRCLGVGFADRSLPGCWRSYGPVFVGFGHTQHGQRAAAGWLALLWLPVAVAVGQEQVPLLPPTPAPVVFPSDQNPSSRRQPTPGFQRQRGPRQLIADPATSTSTQPSDLAEMSLNTRFELPADLAVATNPNAALQYLHAIRRNVGLPTPSMPDHFRQVLSGQQPVEGASSEVLDAIDGWVRPAVRLVRRGAGCPICDWGTDLSEGVDTDTEWLADLQRLVWSVHLSAAIALHRGNEDAAIDDWVAGFRLADRICDQRQVVTLLTAMSAQRTLLDSIEPRLARLSRGGLERLSAALAKRSPVADLQAMARVEVDVATQLLRQNATTAAGLVAAVQRLGAEGKPLDLRTMGVTFAEAGTLRGASVDAGRFAAWLEQYRSAGSEAVRLLGLPAWEFESSWADFAARLRSDATLTAYHSALGPVYRQWQTLRVRSALLTARIHWQLGQVDRLGGIPDPGSTLALQVRLNDDQTTAIVESAWRANPGDKEPMSLTLSR